jgi:hypothetical protein
MKIGNDSTGLSVVFSAKRGAVQEIAASSNVDVIFNTAELDTGGYYSTTTGVFTPKVAGWYYIEAGCVFDTLTDADVAYIKLMKNTATEVARGTDLTGVGGDVGLQASRMVQFNGTTDNIKVTVFQASGGAKNVKATTTYFHGFLIRQT